MTYGDILITVISEAFNETPETISQMFEHNFSIIGTRGNHDQEVSDQEAEKLLAELRKNPSAIVKHYMAGFVAFRDAQKMTPFN